jgi:hypothetical protein
MGRLEEELAKATQISEAELTEKIETMKNLDNISEALAFADREIWAPLIAAQRNAILRLAHEVDELRESRH